MAKPTEILRKFSEGMKNNVKTRREGNVKGRVTAKLHDILPDKSDQDFLRELRQRERTSFETANITFHNCRGGTGTYMVISFDESSQVPECLMNDDK
jgi:hypothetical protein